MRILIALLSSFGPGSGPGRGHCVVFLQRHFITLTVPLSTLARVVGKVDNAMHRISHYPADSVVSFVNTHPLYSDLSSGLCYPAFEELGPVVQSPVKLTQG